MTPAQRHREDTFRRHADWTEFVRCYFAAEGGCRGRLQAAHIISAQRLKREHQHNSFRHINGQEPYNHSLFAAFLDDVLADGRNGVPACERHHNLHEGPVLHCQPPAAFYEFVADYELEHIVDNANERGTYA